MFSKLKKAMCIVFGHKFDDVEYFIYEMKKCAKNMDKLDISIKCKRCSKTVRHNSKDDRND